MHVECRRDKTSPPQKTKWLVVWPSYLSRSFSLNVDPMGPNGNGLASEPMMIQLIDAYMRYQASLIAWLFRAMWYAAKYILMG